jgi:hypothetical protein
VVLMREDLVVRDSLSQLCGEVSGRDVFSDLVNEVLSEGKASSNLGTPPWRRWAGRALASKRGQGPLQGACAADAF